MSGIVLAEGVVEVTGDGKAAGRDIVRDIERSGDTDGKRAGEGIGRSVFGGIVGAWAAIGGTELVGNFLKGAVTNASDLNETISKSTVIFGDQMGAMDAWAGNASRTVGLSRSAALAAAAGFGDMFTQLGFTGDAAAGMSREVVQAAADLGSFSNLDTADVTERIAAAFRGEYDSLQAVIPNISAARVESEALTMTGKDTAASLTAQEKAAAVLAIVQKDGARAMGDFARTSEGAANQQKIMTAQMEDQQAKLGSLLLPAWTGFLGVLNDGVIPAISSTIDWMSQNGDTMLLLGGVVGGAALAYWGITSAMAVYRAFSIASAAATGGLTFAQWALNAALSANPIGLVITLIAALVAGIIWVATQTTFFQDVWANVTSFIGTAWQWLWENVLNPVFTAIGAVFTWLYNNIIMPIVTGIMLYIGLWAAVITWLWESVVSPVFGWIGQQAQLVGLGFSILWQTYVQPAINAIGAVISWVWQSIISPVFGFIGSAANAVGSVFAWLWSSAISPAINGIGSAISWVWNSLINPVFSAIGNAVQVVGDTFRNIFGAIGGFITNAFSGALNAVRGPINGIIGLVNGAVRALNGISVTIPDWVPVVGGQKWGLSLPTIPMLARGAASAPDVFIAGENGPELIVGRGGSRVYPADQTRRMVGDGGGEKHFHLEQKIYAEDPIIASRQAAREAARYLGV